MKLLINLTCVIDHGSQTNGHTAHIIHLQLSNMKHFLLSCLLVAALPATAQTTESEIVDWEHLDAYAAKSFAYHTDEVDFKCKDCRYIEIRSASGVSGYLVIGDAPFSVRSEQLDDLSHVTMIRLSPKDIDEHVHITKAEAIRDEGFNAMSLLILQRIFRRCYHTGMEARIPASGDYTIDFFAVKEGDVLAAYYKGNMEIHHLSQGNK